jgi:hypothetical protein
MASQGRGPSGVIKVSMPSYLADQPGRVQEKARRGASGLDPCLIRAIFAFLAALR